MNKKYIICCDFDGVLHSYVSGWQGATVISDPPVPGALEWLFDMTMPANYERFEIAIYSSRSKEPGGIEAMQAWIRNWTEAHLRECHPDEDPARLHNMAHFLSDMLLTFPTQKPAASMTIDDRAFHFQGRFPEPQALLDFKPWTKIPPPPQRVFLDGVELHNDVVVSADAARGEVEVLLPVAKRTMWIGPEYVPLIKVGGGPGYTVKLTGAVKVEYWVSGVGYRDSKEIK